MIASLEVYVWLICLCVPPYWAAGRWLPRAQMPILLLVSALLLYSLSPLIPLILALYYLFAWGVFAAFRAGRIGTGLLKRLSWLSFAPLAIMPFVSGERAMGAVFGELFATAPGAADFAWLGISYTAIRAFLVIRQAETRGGFAPAASAAALLFFGSFAAGPIAGSDIYRRENLAPRLSLDAAVRGVSRIGWGAALILVAAPALRALDLAGMPPPLGAWADVYRHFLALYLDFAGYCDIAIGTALLFGVTMPENFRLPLLARSIQEFWQRWHMTLSGFIGTYLFKPLVRAYGHPSLAIFVAFVLAGLWHRLSWTYLLWGIGHGAALAGHMAWRKRRARLGLPPLGLPGQVAGWFATITYVALLSAIANAESLAAAGALVRRLLGG